MKTLLYTGYDKAYESLAKITVPRMYEYCAIHGIDCAFYERPLIDVPNGIYWTGVCGALKAFEDGYDRAIYLDVDQLVTNMDYDIQDGIGFHVSKDWGEDAVQPWQFSMCGFSVRKEAVLLLESALELEPAWRNRPFPEQGPMQEVVFRMMGDLPHMVPNKEGYTGLINVHPRKVFNCVPDQICPGNVPEPWQKGDWCAHLTMVDLPRRIEIANEILASL